MVLLTAKTNKAQITVIMINAVENDRRSVKEGLGYTILSVVGASVVQVQLFSLYLSHHTQNAYLHPFPWKLAP